MDSDRHEGASAMVVVYLDLKLTMLKVYMVIKGPGNRFGAHPVKHLY